MHDDDLTRAERDAFAALPREADPGDLLEERTVRALRVGGLLGAPRRRGLVLTPARGAIAAAAALVLIVGSYALGSQAGARGARAAVAGGAGMPAMTQAAASNGQLTGPLATAADVQRAGSAYITALAQLGRAASGSDSVAVLQGREAAVATLLGAADLLMRMTPDQPLPRDLLATLDLSQPPPGRAALDSAAASRRDIIWF